MTTNKNYIKHKRKLITPPPGILGFTFSHKFNELLLDVAGSDKKQGSGVYAIDCNLTFVYYGAVVIIHNNDDDVEKSFATYVNKVRLIKQMAMDALHHLNTGSGPFVTRNFLNDSTFNDGFGATLFITVDPDHKENYCIFEISSCYKKYRYGINVKGMKHYLKSVIKFITEEEKDLAIINKLIQDRPVIGESDGA